MKAVRTEIKKGFESGIRPEDIPTRNSGLFVECRQARVGKAGLEGSREGPGQGVGGNGQEHGQRCGSKIPDPGERLVRQGLNSVRPQNR